MPYLYVEPTHGRTVLLASDLSLHVAMQLGPYLHPVVQLGVFGVWSLRILISPSLDLR